MDGSPAVGPWLRVTFAMVPSAAWPGSGRWPSGTTRATGPGGQLGRPGVSDAWGVVCHSLYLCLPGCARVHGVRGSLALIHRGGGAVCMHGVHGSLALFHRLCVVLVCHVCVCVCARAVSLALVHRLCTVLVCRAHVCAVTLAPWRFFTLCCSLVIHLLPVAVCFWLISSFFSICCPPPPPPPPPGLFFFSNPVLFLKFSKR